MCNGSTYNSTAKRHFFSPFIFYLLSLCVNPTVLAKTEFINVYLKLNSTNEVKPLIASFNHYLEQKKILKNYQITPFLVTYPLHVTLYLTHYKTQYTQELIRRIKKLARQVHPISLKTTNFIAFKNAYVMLAVKNNNSLHQLSNKVVLLLNDLHDKKMPIPQWAAGDSTRRNLFKHYGSPGVFSLYNPHFSIIEPMQITSEQQNTLAIQLKTLIKQYEEKNDTQKTAKAFALAVGIADHQGQITKELAAFPLLQ
jgi:hypothetical protein